MDMSGFGLAIIAVIVFVSWCVLARDLNEQAQLPREKQGKQLWHPDWHNREIDE